MSYFNNHNHDETSNATLGFSDSTNKITELIQRAYDLGLTGLAITNHEGISSHIKALKYYNKMKKDRPFTLALGNEIYLLTEEEDLQNRDPESEIKHPYYHFILTALDTEGHKQLRELSTRAWIRSYKKGKQLKRPTYYSDLEEIIKVNQGHIIGAGACLGSRIDKLLLQDDMQGAIQEVNKLINIFGKGNFYLEVQPPREKDCEQSIVNRKMLKLSELTGVDIIPSSDSHYLSKQEAFVHKVFLQSQEGDREVDEFYATAYLMDDKELRDYLKIDYTDEQINKMYETSNQLAQRIQEYNITHKPIIPEIPIRHIPKDCNQTDYFKEYYNEFPNFGYYAGQTGKDNPPLSLHEKYFFYQIEQGLIDKVVNKNKDLKTYIARLDEEFEQFRLISVELGTKIPCYFSSMSKIIDIIWESNSLSMPGRGSSASSLTNYLLEVTQIDPVPLSDYLPFWRFINLQRGIELPDIDNDSEASKKYIIINNIKKYFGEDRVLNVVTFSTLSSKTAIERSCKGLGLPDDVAGYLKSLIPVNRGKVQSIKDCLYGNKEKGIKPVYEFINEIKKYEHLKECLLGLEGLVVNRGIHAAGIIVCNEPYVNYIAAMKSLEGTLTTCYDLWDAEEAGCIKFDMLTVEAADKIHNTMDKLIEAGHIQWQGSLKETYYKYLHPDVLVYDNPDMWKILPSIYSVFQFDTPTSSKALSYTHPNNVMDLSATNSLLRLMPDNVDETPLDKYKRYKEDKNNWIEDTTDYGLNKKERDCLWEYLSSSYGLAESQEKVMKLSMDKRISGYSLKESNALRKSIAKILAC